MLRYWTTATRARAARAAMACAVLSTCLLLPDLSLARGPTIHARTSKRSGLARANRRLDRASYWRYGAPRGTRFRVLKSLPFLVGHTGAAMALNPALAFTTTAYAVSPMLRADAGFAVPLLASITATSAALGSYLAIDRFRNTPQGKRRHTELKKGLKVISRKMSSPELKTEPDSARARAIRAEIASMFEAVDGRLPAARKFYSHDSLPNNNGSTQHMRNGADHSYQRAKTSFQNDLATYNALKQKFGGNEHAR